jgi:hypothetical protein
MGINKSEFNQPDFSYVNKIVSIECCDIHKIIIQHD